MAEDKKAPKKPETNLLDLKTQVWTDEKSRDNENGILVFETNAEAGTEFTLKVDDERLKAKVDNGQIWFYVGRELTEESNIRLA